MAALATLTGGFAVGIFLRTIYTFDYWPMIGAAVLGIACLAINRFKPRRAYALAGGFLLLMSFGMLRAALADTPPPEPFASDVTQKVSYEGVVVGDPSLKDATEQVVVEVEKAGKRTKIEVTAPRSVAVSAGERVSVFGTLALPKSFEDDNGRTFRYDQYLARQGIYFTMFASVREVAPAPWYSLAALFSRIKNSFIAGLDRALPEPDASLASGIVIGGKAGLGDALTAAFTRSGLVQIVVLSGYNVMVVAEGVLIALSALKMRKRTAAAAAAAAVLLFVLIAGASSTALRALLMAFIALYARATSRSYVAGRALLLVVFLMLLWRPATLAYDPSFDLSALATAGLVWLSPLVELKLAKIKSDFWRGALATTLAAQLAVWPLLLYETGTLSPIAIPANLLVLPVVPAAMAAAAVAGILGMFLGSFSIITALPSYLSTRFIIGVALLASKTPAAILPAFPFFFVLLAYALLFALAKRSSITRQLRLAKKAEM